MNYPKKYDYGWMVGGHSNMGVGGGVPSDPHVVADWLLDEASGNIVDQISAITLPPTDTPTYSQVALSPWDAFSPGIKFRESNGFALGRFQKDTATASLNVGVADHVVVEFVGNITSAITAGNDTWALGVSGQPIPAGALKGITVGIFIDGVAKFGAYFVADDGVGVYLETPAVLATVLATGLSNDFHKYRAVFDRGGNIELFVDGVSQGTASMASVSGKSITNDSVVVGGPHFTILSTGHDWKGTLLRVRVSIGTDVLSNNFGGE